MKIETEAIIKEECKAVTRCIPTDDFCRDDLLGRPGICIRTGKPSQRKNFFARSY